MFPLVLLFPLVTGSNQQWQTIDSKSLSYIFLGQEHINATPFKEAENLTQAEGACRKIAKTYTPPTNFSYTAKEATTICYYFLEHRKVFQETSEIYFDIMAQSNLLSTNQIAMVKSYWWRMDEITHHQFLITDKCFQSGYKWPYSRAFWLKAKIAISWVQNKIATGGENFKQQNLKNKMDEVMAYILFRIENSLPMPVSPIACNKQR